MRTPEIDTLFTSIPVVSLKAIHPTDGNMFMRSKSNVDSLTYQTAPSLSATSAALSNSCKSYVHVFQRFKMASVTDAAGCQGSESSSDTK